MGDAVGAPKLETLRLTWDLEQSGSMLETHTGSTSMVH